CVNCYRMTCGVNLHCSNKAVLTYRREVGSVDPWTPTSNLKMLISAASPDIRNREKELCMDADGRGGVDSTQRVEINPFLLYKFLARYPDCPNPGLNNDICLDDVATELNVERRRIYDIMNVLESLHMVSRSAKNRYAWHGRTKLAQTLAILKQVGEEHKYGQQMQQIRQRLLDKEFDFDGEEKENAEEVELESTEQGQKELFFVELPGVEFKAASVNSRKDKSLRVMSQKFVMLFLVSSPRVVSLDVAAKILIGEDQGADRDKNKFKTKVRRLYDIANVLRSLKLIEKVHVTEERGKKPAFEWVGPEEFPPCVSTPLVPSRSSVENCAKNLFSSPGTKRGFTRHPSLIKMAKSIQDDRRKINSAPSSPAKTSLGQHIKPSSEDNVVLFLKGVMTPNVKSHPAFLQVIHRASTSRQLRVTVRYMLTSDRVTLSSTGSKASPAQEMTPTNIRLLKPAAASPNTTQQAHQLHSPSPAIFNFTLQNLGLISGSGPGSCFSAPQTPECANALPGPLALQQRSMVFFKPVSPVPIQQSVALISMQQVRSATINVQPVCLTRFW
uniref:Transcription factor E2F8 n=1 Tax=Mola mola TaxID=94237 RepID=A0A3Q4AX15_MOLML